MPTKKEIWGRIFVNTFILCYSKLTKMIQLMIEYNMVVVLSERMNYENNGVDFSSFFQYMPT